MENTRIVKLGPTGQVVSTSFEDAFGEYSEARGGRRAARQAARQERRLARVERKRELRAAKQEARKERKVGRQEVKQAAKEARIAKRAAAQAARQAKRLAAMEARQTKRSLRKESRLQRRALGQPEEIMDEEMMETSEAEMPLEDEFAPETGGEVGGEEGGFSETQTGGESEEDNQGGAVGDEWGGTGSVYENDNDIMGTPAAGTGEEGDTGESEFESLVGAEDMFYEFADGDGVEVKKPVKKTAEKLEWNKEFLSRLLVKRAKLKGVDADTTGIDNQIAMRKSRIAELEGQLTKYANAEGDFVSADGFEDEFSFADGRRMNRGLGVRRKRAREVLKAKGLARRLRRKLSKVTPVAKGLNPKFSSNRIVVPAQEASSYTGLNGLDLIDDFDAPDTTIVELKSNAEGDKPKKKINWVAVGIGAAVALVGIWAIRKYKVLGK